MTNTSKSRTFYGITAKQAKILVDATANSKELAEWHEFVRARIGKYNQSGRVVKAQRWEKVAALMQARLASLAGGTANAVQVPSMAMTYTKPAKQAKPRAKTREFDLDGFLAKSGMTADQLMVALARRVK